MRNSVLAALAWSFAGAACSQPSIHLSDEQIHARAVSVSKEQLRILRSIPRAGPDSADEPRGIDLTTGADINLTYWAPLFVISIMTPPHQPAVAVLSEIQFPKTNGQAVDPHDRPVKASWTSAAKCAAITKFIAELDEVVASSQKAVLHPDMDNNTREYDGAGFSLRIAGSGSNASSNLTISGNDYSAVGLWASRFREAVKDCWAPLS